MRYVKFCLWVLHLSNLQNILIVTMKWILKSQRLMGHKQSSVSQTKWLSVSIQPRHVGTDTVHSCAILWFSRLLNMQVAQ
jgi:hypothetical protein